MNLRRRFQERFRENGAAGVLAAAGRRLCDPPVQLAFALWRRPFTGRPVELSRIRTILAVKFHGIGNLLLFTPALQTLRRHLPAARIILLSDGRALPLLENSGLYDEKIILPAPPGQIVSPILRFRIVRTLRRHRPDLILSSFPMAIPQIAQIYDLLGAAWCAGYDLDGPPEKFSHRLAYDPGRHEVCCNLDLLRALGMTDPVLDLCLSPGESHRREAREFLARQGGGPPWFAFHAGSYPDMTEKRWPRERFAELGDRLAERFGGRVILVGGMEEKETAWEIGRRMKSAPVDATGALSLLGTASLLAECQLLVSNDSGIMHLAAAVGTPVAAVFGPTSPRKNHPWTSPRKYRVIRAGLDCSPCHQVGRMINCPDVKCMAAVSVDRVWEEIQSLF